MSFKAVIILIFPFFQALSSSLPYVKDKCSSHSFHLRKLTSSKTYTYDPKEVTKWIPPAFKGKTKGIVFILHGLNNKPSSMSAFVSLSHSLNYLVLRGSHSGHRGDLDEFKQVEHIQWMKDIFHHHCLLKIKSEELKLPLYFIGYSLGALTTLDYFIHRNEPIPFKKMALLAPALRSHSYLTILSWFDWLKGSTLIPSRNLKQYRFYEGTPLRGYRALYKSQKQLQNDLMKKAHVDTLLFINPKDELVSIGKIQKLMKWSYLSRWKIKLLNNEGHLVSKKINHLILDDKTLGKSEWEKVKRMLKEFLEKN